MKKLMLAMVAGLFVASTAMGNWVLNPSFDDEGDLGGTWSAEFWGDGATAPGVLHARTDGTWRDDSFSGAGRDWVMQLEEQGFELPGGEVWQQHTVGESLGGQTLTFSGDFYLHGGAGGGALTAELGFFDSTATWITDAELLLDLSGLWDNRDTWFTISDSVVAPANAEAWQVTLRSTTWGDAGDRMLAVDNVSVIPEPGTIGMLALGLLGIAGLRRRMKKLIST